jgi:hypothetical protein
MRTTTRRRLTTLLVAPALAAALAGCAGDDPEVAAIDDDPAVEASADDAPDEGSGDDTVDEQTAGTSTPADEDLVQQEPGSVTQGEAEAIANAYLGLTLEEAEAQALIDDRDLRVGAQDGEQFMLTEDYVIGRATATVDDGVVTAVTIEATDGPYTARN